MFCVEGRVAECEKRVELGAEAVWAVVGAVAGLADAAGGRSGDARAAIVLDWDNVGALILYPNRKEVKEGRTKMY